jgi:rod shape-determining protein MreD
LGLQTLLPTLQPALGLLNLPFVITLNLMLWCRSAVSTMLLGALTGCVYDGLTHGPVGLHGIVYTICGYLVAHVGPHLRRDHALVLGCFFAAAYLTYEFLFGVVRNVLVSSGEGTDLALRLVLAAVHAGAGLFVFTMLSKAAGKP